MSVHFWTYFGVPLETILVAADWSSSETFKRFYLRSPDKGEFARAVPTVLPDNCLRKLLHSLLTEFCFYTFSIVLYLFDVYLKDTATYSESCVPTLGGLLCFPDHVSC